LRSGDVPNLEHFIRTTAEDRALSFGTTTGRAIPRHGCRNRNVLSQPDLKKEEVMASFLEDLAARAGLQSDQAHQGVGALLTLLKNRLDPEAFAQLQKSIPNASEVLAKCQSMAPEMKGGVLEAMKDVAGKLFGGNASDAEAAVNPHFGNFGLSPDHLKMLLPAMSQMLANKLPPDVMNQIRKHLPGFDHSDEDAIAPSSTA
jgi:uncharacterized protein (DUF2267 family)